MRIRDWSSDVCSSYLDDFAKMVNGIAGTVAGAGREAEAAMRERAKEWVGRMDFVGREEFEAVKQVAAKARAEAEALKDRTSVVEGKSASVRVDLGGCRISNKQTHHNKHR